MKHLKSELEFVQHILKQGGSKQEERQKIFELYKKFIDPTHLYFDVNGCSSCSDSLNKLWTKLKEYVLSNGDKFVDE